MRAKIRTHQSPDTTLGFVQTLKADNNRH